MAVTIKFKNKERFFKKLESIVPRMTPELASANLKSAQAMVASAQRLAPTDDGTLRDSIRMEPGQRPTSFIVQAGGETTTKPVREGLDASYDYALGIEYSTQDMRAQPFFWPAFRLQRKPMKARAARAIKKAIKAAGF